MHIPGKNNPTFCKIFTLGAEGLGFEQSLLARAGTYSILTESLSYIGVQSVITQQLPRSSSTYLHSSAPNEPGLGTTQPRQRRLKE